MKIIAGSNNKLLATRLAITLNIKYIEPKITYFSDSEIKLEIQESLHNEDIIIVQNPLQKPTNDHLIELFLLIDTAKKAGANKIILVMPYFWLCKAG
ncbi:MAG TPA: ribose-phosphate pyrophosphokinase-like domain-containing protein [Rickettsia endosymbiont of Columbicola hoogstraali]|nr:ribose-phosphate pyrophosphokinase-like domain-containing protein [Rickettsia endosymbiont of Columbicola hoogstraali]